ncbi:MAG: SPOR domain-containing protein, partial [Dongiaceae bacterium]
MLTKHPNVQRDEPATSPALSRRRDHVLHGDPDQLREPRLLPVSNDDDPALQDRDFFADDDFDPEIPPPPIGAAPQPDDAAIGPPERGSGRLRLWPLAAGVLALAVLGSATWIVYDVVVADAGGGDVPYISAEAGPEKIRPQEEGGMEVPNQDIRVYNELTGSPAAPEAEVLLPPPEAPVSPPVPAEEQTAAETAEIPSVPAPEVEPAAGGESAEQATSSDQPQPGVEEPAVEAVDPVAEEEPVQTAAVTGAFRIQLAAVKSEDAAQVGWKKMTKSHPDVLGALSLNVVKVDRSSGGALYRLQAGPFADRATAEA